jgi:hypothetical protein
MHLMLLGTSLALAGGFTSTTDSNTTRKSDYGFTSGEDKREECEKTLAGCVDDLKSIEDYDVYHRELDLMLGTLEPAHMDSCQTDIGHSMAGGIIAGVQVPDAEIFTTYGGGVFTEHWFMQAGWIINYPGASFYIDSSTNESWADVEATLDADQPYVRKQFRNRVLPTPEQVEHLLHNSPQVERYAFDAVLDGERIGVLLREVHYTAQGSFHDQHDFWVYLDDSDCLNVPLLHNAGNALIMRPWEDNVDDLSPGQFFAVFKHWGNAEHGAVITYTLGVASDSGLL